MTKPKYKVGQTITANISGERVSGEIEEIDKQEGEIVYSLKDKERYVYERQITSAR